MTLNPTQRSAFEDLAYPRNATISPGGVTDIWNNTSAATLTRTISYTGNAAPPALNDATYDTATHALNITLSERLGDYDSTKIVLYNSTKQGNVTFSSGDFEQASHGYLNATLDSTQRAAFEDLGPRRYVDIRPGGVTDIWNSSNAAHLIGEISYTGDTSPPDDLTGASYATGSYDLTLTLDERLGAGDGTLIALHDSTGTGNVTFGASAFAVSGRTITAALDGAQKTAFEDLSHPRYVAISPGGITDIWNNSNAVQLTRAISYTGNAGPPELHAAAYDTVHAVLNLTLSERLAAYDSTNIVLHNSTKQGNVTFPASQFAQASHGYLHITLDSAQRSAFEDLKHPRHVAISPGGVTDIWNSANSAPLAAAASYSDTTPPALNAAAYVTTSGLLTLTLSEDLAAHDSASIVLHNSAGAGNVTFGPGAFTEGPAGTLTATLNGTQVASFEALNHPRYAAVLQNGATDIWNNPNAMPLARATSYSDTTPPALNGTSYSAVTGTLNITLSERLGDHDATKIIVYDSAMRANVTFGSDNFTRFGATLSETLAGDAKSKFEGLNAPKHVIVLPGGVTDIWNNANTANLTGIRAPPPPPPAAPPQLFALPPLVLSPAPADRALVVMEPDDAPPDVARALFDADARVLYVTFDETVDAGSVDASGFELRSGGHAAALGNVSTTHGDVRRIAVPVASNATLGALNLTVAAGSVLDTSGNPVGHTRNFSVANPSMPAVSSASYDEDAGLLRVSFNMAVAAGNVGLLSINGISLNGTGIPDAVSDHLLFFALGGDLADALSAAPVLDAGRGAAFSLDGVPSMSASGVPVSAAGPASADSLNAVYNNVTGALHIEMAGARIQNLANMTLRDSSAALALRNVTVVFNGGAVSSGGSEPAGDGPLYLDIGGGALFAGGAVPAASGIPVRVFAGISAPAAYGIPVGNATSVLLAEPGLVLVAADGGIHVLNATGGPDILSFAGTNDTGVLDMHAMRGTPYIAVLTEGAVRFLDLADPESPRWASELSVTGASPYGVLAAVTLEGLPHIVAITPGAMTLVHVSDAAAPKVISAARLPEAPHAGFDVASFGSDTLYMSLDSDAICWVNMTNTAGYAAGCVDHEGIAGSAAVMAVGSEKFVVSGGSVSGASVRSPDLKEAYYIRTPQAPTDVGAVTLYNSTYVLAAADTLRIYDVAAEPRLVSAAGSYRVVEVLEFGGSAYAALLDWDGAAYLMNLGGPAVPPE